MLCVGFVSMLLKNKIIVDKLVLYQLALGHGSCEPTTIFLPKMCIDICMQLIVFSLKGSLFSCVIKIRNVRFSISIICTCVKVSDDTLMLQMCERVAAKFYVFQSC